MDNYDQLRDILVRSETGGVVTEDERRLLREALLGFAPSSDEYRMINDAINKNPYQGQERNREGSGGLNIPRWEPGTPTLDWLGGIFPDYQLPTDDEMADSWQGQGPTIPNNIPPPVQTLDEGPDTITSSPQTAARDSNADLLAEMNAGTNPPATVPRVSSSPSSTGFGPGGSGPVANNTYSNFMQDTGSDLPDPQPLPGGYSFSEMAPVEIANAYNDPALMMRLLASDSGQGPATESMMMPYLQSARALSGMGVLGGGGSMNFEDTESDPITAFQNVEEFMDTFNQPGMQFIDPGALNQDILGRAVGQDYTQLTDQNGQPLGNDGIIQLTNDAMMASTPFMTPEAAGLMSSKLEAAALEYKHLLATGNITMTYPAYLQNVLNAGEWLE